MKRQGVRQTFEEVVDRVVPERCLLISVGLPGSWKSQVTEEIAKRKNFQILRSDIIRLEVLKDEDIFDPKVASDPDRREKVYEEMFRRAEKSLRAGARGLVLDATFFTQALRSRAADLAFETGRTLIVAECVCSEKKSIERILKRTKENYESNALTREAYLNNKTLFQAVDIGDLKRGRPGLLIIYVKIDTESDTASDWEIVGLEKG